MPLLLSLVNLESGIRPARVRAEGLRGGEVPGRENQRGASLGGWRGRVAQRLGPAYPEIVETCVSSWNGLEGEGTQYEYWSGKVTKNNNANDCLKKYQAKYQATSAQPTSACSWWERSVRPNNATSFACVGYTGYPNDTTFASTTNGVCP